MATVHKRFSESRQQSVSLAAATSGMKGGGDESVARRRTAYRFLCLDSSCVGARRFFPIAVLFMFLFCCTSTFGLRWSSFSLASTHGSGSLDAPVTKETAARRTFCRAWDGPLHRFGSAMALWAPTAAVVDTSASGERKEHVPFEILVEATPLCGATVVDDDAALGGVSRIKFQTASTVILRFANASNFASVFQADADGALAPNPAFGISSVMIGTRERMQPPNIGDGAEFPFLRQEHQHGLATPSALSHEERMCLSTALETPCAVGFRVMQAPLLGVQVDAGELVWWCVVVHPVVNKDMLTTEREAVDRPVLFGDAGGPLHVFMHAAELRLGMPWTTTQHPSAIIVGPPSGSIVLIDQHSGRPRDPLLVVVSPSCPGLWALSLRVRCNGRDMEHFPAQHERVASVSSPMQNISVDASWMSFLGCREVALEMRATVTWAQQQEGGAPSSRTVHLATTFVYPYVEGTVGRLELNGGAPVVNRRCAEFLAPWELCISNLAFRVHLDMKGQLQDASQVLNVSAPKALSRKLVTLVPDDTHPNTNQGHPCLTLVDGHVSYVGDANGEARFPALVVRVNPDSSCWTGPRATWTLRASMPFCSGPSGSCMDQLLAESTLTVAIPTSVLHAAAAQSAREEAAHRHPPTPPLRSVELPILVSLCVHQNMDALLVQLQNIAAFVPTSIVVLHLAPTWVLTPRDANRLRDANGTVHPMVFVNPTRYRWSFSLLFAIQLRNAVYVHTSFPWLRFTHVLCVASNELFVRRGVAAFVQRYDMSSNVPATFMRNGFEAGGLRDFHGYPMAELPRFNPFKADRWASRSWHGRLPPYGVHGSLTWLSARVEALANTTIDLPMEQLFTEGSFFNRSIALLLSEALDVVFPMCAATDNDASCGAASKRCGLGCFTNWYSWSELVPYTLLQSACNAPDYRRQHPSPPFSSALHALLALRGVHCGPRVSSVAWNRPNWHVTLRDVAWARCSPFASGLFAMKRFSDNMRDPVYRRVQTLAADLIAHTRNTSSTGTGGREETECGRFIPLSLGM